MSEERERVEDLSHNQRRLDREIPTTFPVAMRTKEVKAQGQEQARPPRGFGLGPGVLSNKDTYVQSHGPWHG